MALRGFGNYACLGGSNDCEPFEVPAGRTVEREFGGSVYGDAPPATSCAGFDPNQTRKIDLEVELDGTLVTETIDAPSYCAGAAVQTLGLNARTELNGPPRA